MVVVNVAAADATLGENIKSPAGRSAEGHSRVFRFEGALSSIFSNCCPFSKIASFLLPRAAAARPFVRNIFHVFRRKVRDEETFAEPGFFSSSPEQVDA